MHWSTQSRETKAIDFSAVYCCTCTYLGVNLEFTRCKSHATNHVLPRLKWKRDRSILVHLIASKWALQVLFACSLCFLTESLPHVQSRSVYRVLFSIVRTIPAVSIAMEWIHTTMPMASVTAWENVFRRISVPNHLTTKPSFGVRTRIFRDFCVVLRKFILLNGA